MSTAVILVTLASLPFAWLLVVRPVVRRVAVRSMRRRPVEFLLVVAGSMLATAILTGSLLVGDTFDRSVRSSAFDQLGPIDEIVRVSGLDAGDELVARLDGFEDASVDGTLPLVVARAAVVGFGEQPLVQPVAQLVETDFERAATFGGDPGATGISGPTPAPGTAVITQDVADRIRVGVGDRILVHAYGVPTELTVDRVIDRTGVAGFWLELGQRSYNVFVAPGTIASLVGEATVQDAEPPTVLVAVSNVGGVVGGAARTEAATAALEAALGDTVAAVRPVKQDTLDFADELGAALGELYFTVGMFAVAAGVLLLVNIFVMLADDRRHELGMMRAIGLRRAPMVGQFATEGWIYALLSSLVGAIVGIGFGWVIAWRSAQILSTGEEVDQISVEFTFAPGSIVTGFAIGFLISLLTIVVTSTRIARLNVIAAVRELPDDPTRRPRRRRRMAAGIAAVAGLTASVVGFASGNGYGVLVGPALLAVGLAPLLARGRRSTAAVTIVGLFVLVWAGAVVFAFEALDIRFAIPVFLVQGLMLVAAAVAVLVAHQDRVRGALARATGDSMAVRVGLAYPLARRFRTALTVGMIAIIVLTLTYLSTLSGMFWSQADRIAAETGGGFTVLVQSNPSDPVPMDALAAIDGVDHVAPLAYGAFDFTAADREPLTWPLTGYDERLLVDPPVIDDLGAYPTDDAVWRAVMADPSLIIADEFFLASGVGPPTDSTEVGDVIVMTDPISGAEREVTVAALVTADWIRHGAYYGVANLESMIGERAVASRALLATDDPERVTDLVRTTFVANGVDADPVLSLVEGQLALSGAFFTLMQQFVGAGLVVGMAGIGVIMVRAVRERRREIGVLRALGFPVPDVWRAFVVEAMFVTVEGLLIGIATGLLATYGLARSGASWAEGMVWAPPWASLTIIIAVTIGASLVAAISPARAAARTQPARALRIAD